MYSTKINKRQSLCINTISLPCRLFFPCCLIYLSFSFTDTQTIRGDAFVLSNLKQTKPKIFKAKMSIDLLLVIIS